MVYTHIYINYNKSRKHYEENHFCSSNTALLS